MKRSIYLGFTLIELMIVVMIVGILVVVALPAYQDYVIRSKVAEGLVIASWLKGVVTDNFVNGTTPTKGGLFSSIPTGPLSTDVCGTAGECSLYLSRAGTANVASIVGTTANGLITITYQASLTGGTITLWPSSNGVILAAGTPATGVVAWDCYAAGKPLANGATVQGTILSKYAPANCRV